MRRQDNRASLTPGSRSLACSDRHWMRRALRLAGRGAQAGEVPIGALVVRGGKLLGAAANAPVTRSDPSAHAEILALRRAARRARNYRLPGATLYVTLEPCAMCAGAIVHARVARVVYAAADLRAGAGGSVFAILDDPRLNHRVEVASGIEARASTELLRRFFASRR